MIKSDYSSNDDEKEKSKQFQRIRWTTKVEDLLNTWADIALCYKWLHEASYRKYKRINYIYSIPVIILSTLTGTINVGMAGIVPAADSTISQIIIGLVSIITGLISTLQSFFRYAQTSESHFNAYSGWCRLHRNILIELNLQRKYRKNPKDFVKVCRSEYDRLMEQSPLLPTDVIAEFKLKYGDPNKNGGLIIPDNIDNIKHVEIYKDPDINYEIDEVSKEINIENKVNKQKNNKSMQDKLKHRLREKLGVDVIKNEKNEGDNKDKSKDIMEELKDYNIDVKGLISQIENKMNNAKSKLEDKVKEKREDIDMKDIQTEVNIETKIEINDDIEKEIKEDMR
jgi:hypothetical protein